MSLDPNLALISVKEFKEMSNYPSDKEYPAATTALVEFLINSASKLIETFCDRKFIAGTITEEIRNGNGKGQIRLKQAPLTSTISTIHYWNNDTWEAETGTTFDQHNDEGILYYTDGNYFEEGTYNYKFGYSYGYSQANIPVDLKYACFEIVAMWKKQSEENLHGTNSLSFGDQATSYSFNSLPQNIKSILQSYRRIVPD